MANIIREAVSGIAGVFGSAFDTLVQELGSPDRLSLQAKADPAWPVGGVMAYGECNTQPTGDKTIAVKVIVPDADFAVFLECAAMRLTCTPSGSGWKAGATVFTADGTSTLLSDELAFTTDPTYIAATYDASTGTTKLYLAGVEVNDTTFGEARNTITPLPIWRMGGPPGAIVTDGAVWGRILDPEEMPGFEPPVDAPALPNAIHWIDFSDAGTLTTGGGLVTAVADKIGSADFAAVSTGATPVPLGNVGLDGAFLDTTTTSRRFTTTGFTPLDTGTTPLAVAWVGYQLHPGVGSVWFDTSSASPRPNAYTSTAGKWAISAGTELNSAGNFDTIPHVFLAVFNGASSQLYIDDDTTPVASGAANTGDSNANASLFNIQAGGNVGKTAIGEIVFATGVPSAGQITAEMDRLRTKWGIVPPATGGNTIVFDGTNFKHTFTAGGTFDPSPYTLSCNGVVVAGGGQGGYGIGGGGGAGAVIPFTGQSISSSQTITVGAGGTGGGTSGAHAGGSGGNSSIGSLVTATGGGGGNGSGGSGGNGVTGGSGGGGGVGGGTGGSGSTGGNSGGTGGSFGSTPGGGGGGGAGAVGGNGSTTTAGAGGAGTAYDGTNYGGGGGAGIYANTGGSAGGTGGGGKGGSRTSSSGQIPVAGTANTGGGGGGGGWTDGSPAGTPNGAAGGSGIVIIKYPYPGP